MMTSDRYKVFFKCLEKHSNVSIAIDTNVFRNFVVDDTNELVTQNRLQNLLELVQKNNIKIVSAAQVPHLGMGNLITYLLKRLQFCHITSKTLASSEGNVKISFFRKGEPKSDAEQEVHKNYTRWSACTDWI